MRELDAEQQTLVSDLTLSMAQAARLAPSIHNTQPWRFAPIADGLAVHVDHSRSLPAVDPTGRIRVISCGTAVTNAALAVAVTGLRPVVDHRPSVDDPTLIATIVGTDRGHVHGVVPPRDQARFDVIGRRRAHRRLHRRDALTPQEVEALREAVVGGGARPVLPDARQRRVLGRLLRDAVHHQLNDPPFLMEVDSWIRHPAESVTSGDGIPVASLGTAPYPSDSLVHDGWDDDELAGLPI